MDELTGSRETEVIVDGYRIRGELSVTGGPRRLVDILNSLDHIVTVKDAVLDYPLRAECPTISAPITHIHLGTVLFAIPRGADVLHEDPFEKVNKVPIPCTIVLPGFEVTGNIHMVAEVDPTESQLLTTLHFVPLTDAKVVSLANPQVTWEADVLVINLTRAVVYAPNSRAAIAAA
jgi:hypothetical protein